ncbi:unnamed protein product [Paramecium sonneborni]|uniref:Uncharacterized protein n=1 Tax=Paramecium sonneborni TaxID=65129 RepID=A0A8S1L977_9CILI|nr:unnamed protein product [Paramecium sonneborni]
MSLTINSNIFEIQNQEQINQLINFLKLNGELTRGEFCFKDQAQQKKFNIFRQTYQTLKENFPDFKLKFKCNKGQLQSSTDLHLKTKSDDSRQTFQIKTNDETINSDQSKPFVNQSTQRQIQEEIQSFNPVVYEYQDDDSLRDQESKSSSDESENENLQSINQVQCFPQDELNYLNNTQNEYQLQRSQLPSDILKQINSEENKILEFHSEVAKQDVIESEIKILGLGTASTIQLKNQFILKMIEKLFLQEWNQFINQFNLEQKKFNLYKLKLNQDIDKIQKEIQEFINKISYIDIEFCYYTNYTMIASSKINEFLKSYQIYPFYFYDSFFLVSITQNIHQLQEISQQINNNYRGIFLYFSTLRPFQQQSYSSSDLELCRSQYYEKILALEFKQYCMNQFFNNQYFFLEMNFSHVLQNRELMEKQIKKYIQSCLKSPFLLKFELQLNQKDENFIDQCFKEKLQDGQCKIIYLKKEKSYYLFGNTEELISLFKNIIQERETMKTYFTQTTLFINKSNLVQQFSGQIKFFDLESINRILNDVGFKNDQSHAQDLKYNNPDNINFYYLLQTLEMICTIRQQNTNKEKIQSIYHKFNQNPHKNQLNRLDNGLFSLSSQGYQKGKNEKWTVSLDLVPNNVINFALQRIIELKPKILDSIIQEYLYQDFQEKLVQKNSQISFIKIDEGKYQLSCQNNQIIKQFEDYFSKFVSQKVILNEQILRIFELSSFKKIELQKKNVYYRVESDGLLLISRNLESIQNVTQNFQYYQGFIITMNSLKSQSQEEKPENYQLVQARTGYMKHVLKDFLQKNLQIMDIEFKEDQEISAYCIFHLNFQKLQNFSNQEQMEDASNKLQDDIFQMISPLYFFEIKTDQEAGKIIFQNIIQSRQIYVTFKQQYSDYFITILANKKQFKEVYDNLIQLQFNEKAQENIEFSIYIGQFCIYHNIIQINQSKKQLKVDFEKKGFEVDDQKVRWIIKSKKPSQAFQILSILINKMQDEDEQKNFQDLDKYDIYFGNMSEIKNESSFQSKSFFQSYYELFEDSQQKSHINSIYISESTKKDQQKKSIQNEINIPQKQVQQQLNNFVLQNEDSKNTNFIVPQQLSFQQQKNYSQQNQQIFQKQVQQQQIPEDSLDDSSEYSKSQLSNSLSNQMNITSLSFNNDAQTTFDKQCLLVEFQQNQIPIVPPMEEKLVQHLSQNFKNHKFEYFQPKVDQDYVKYFNKIAQQTITLYIIQKPDKEYHNEFSKKLLFYLNYDVLIEKFVNHSSLIIICCKANKAAHYQIPNREKSYQICLKDPNQVLPFLWVRRKSN